MSKGHVEFEGLDEGFMGMGWKKKAKGQWGRGRPNASGREGEW